MTTSENTASQPGASPKRPLTARVRSWIETLHRNPSDEAAASMERRARLLQELNRAVADAPDDVPIKYVVDRLNRTYED